MRDPFADLTQDTWMQIRPIWASQIPNCIHKDQTFGTLICEQLENLIFILDYEGWQIKLQPETAEIHIMQKGKVQLAEPYIIERLAMPFLRCIRGAVLWHAGAVAFPHKVCCFLAPSGLGKTTITAAVLSQFPLAQLICDDVLAIAYADSSPICLPSATHLAMRHDLFNHAPFIENQANLGHKQLLFLNPSKCLQQPRILSHLYLLEDLMYEHSPVTLSQALPTILKHQMTFSMLPNEIRRFQFRACIQVLKAGIQCSTLGVAGKNWTQIAQSLG